MKVGRVPWDDRSIQCCYLIYLDDIIGFTVGVQCHVELGLKTRCFTG